jgi:bis(5'-adenosyl)-triphosphatase
MLISDVQNISCPFCRQDILSDAFMQSEDYYAIYNIAPVLPGHSLVIPKKHIKSLLELNEAEFIEFFTFSKKVTQTIIRAFNGEGFDWSVQDGESAGQTIFHLHLHIIPRIPHDLKENENWYPLAKESEKAFLDSTSRPHLSTSEYHHFTDLLKKTSRLL